MAELYHFAKKEIERALGRGLPEWYKEKLANAQFSGQEEEE